MNFAGHRFPTSWLQNAIYWDIFNSETLTSAVTHGIKSCTSHGRCSKTQRRHLNRSPLTYGPQTGCHTPQSESFCVEKTIHFWGPFCAIGVEPCWTFLIAPTLLMVCSYTDSHDAKHDPCPASANMGSGRFGPYFFRRQFPEILLLFSLVAQWKGKTYCQSDVVPIKMRQGTGIFHLQLISSLVHPCAMFVGKTHMLTRSHHIPWGAQSPPL